MSKFIVTFDKSNEDIPTLVKKFGLGEGRTGGFVQLSSADIAEIYKIAAKATL